jgi:hypothetical protein
LYYTTESYLSLLINTIKGLHGKSMHAAQYDSGVCSLAIERYGEALRMIQDNLGSKNFYAFNPEFDNGSYTKIR